MNKLLVLTILIPCISAYMFDPHFIEIEKRIMNMFDCEYYNNIDIMDFYSLDYHASIIVNKAKSTIHFTITDKGSIVTDEKKFGLVSSCPDHYSKMINGCDNKKCPAISFYSIKVKSSIYNLEKFFNFTPVVQKSYYKYFI